MEAQERNDRRLSGLERWRSNLAGEMRWWEEHRTMIEALEADLVYRQRRHAEGVKFVSTFWKVVIGAMTLLVGVSTVGTFVLLVTR